MIANKTITNGKYTLNVSYKTPCRPPQSKIPREIVTPKIRTPYRFWINYNDEIIHEIFYPKNLWFTSIEEDDPLEHFIIETKNMFPDWTKIEIN